MIPKSKSNIGTHKKKCIDSMHFKLFLLNIVSATHVRDPQRIRHLRIDHM